MRKPLPGCFVITQLSMFLSFAVAAGGATLDGAIEGPQDPATPKRVFALPVVITEAGETILPTKPEILAAASDPAASFRVAASEFSLNIEAGPYYCLFAFADLNDNGVWDPATPEPFGWYTNQPSGDFVPVAVRTVGISIKLEAPTPMPKAAQSADGGSLVRVKGYPVLQLTGDAHARGFAHGKLLAPQIIDFFRFYFLEDKMKSARDYEQGFAKFLHTHFRYPPEFTAECEAVIEGMKASGASLHIPELNRDFNLTDLYAINGYIETRAMRTSCTQFAAWGERTKSTDVDGGMVTGRNMDGEIDLRRVTVSHFLLMAVSPSEPGQKRFVSMMWPGFVATISGMNEDGFYAMENAGITAPGPTVRDMVFFSWTMRQALATQGANATPDEVQSLIDSFDNAAGGSCGPGCITLFATPYEGQQAPAFFHEGDRFGDRLRFAGDVAPHVPQALAASNHPLLYGVSAQRPGKVFETTPSFSSLFRYEAGSQKLAAWQRTSRSVGTAEMRELLQTVAHGTTEYAIITRPNKLEFDVAVASMKSEPWDAPYQPWTTFHFEDVFAQPVARD
ncbi:hypothetical protein [Aeoliella sp. SH292]|uniref:hypothetical protein n=1 Tax=Aeoliella sp. SH292 TaxID=3454464 RepID=UPI003F964493